MSMSANGLTAVSPLLADPQGQLPPKLRLFARQMKLAIAEPGSGHAISDISADVGPIADWHLSSGVPCKHRCTLKVAPLRAATHDT